MRLDDRLEDFLARQKKQGLYRSRPLVTGQGNHTIHFCSNDYLSLQNEPDIKKAYREGVEQYATGSGGSMYLGGYHALHHQLEQTVADALGVDACLLFSSGYAANLSIAMLMGIIKTHVLIDKAVHASFYDGLRLAKVNFSRYRHNNLDDARRKIMQVPEQSVLFTESVFSMSGQKTSLLALAQLANQRNMKLIIDEAHAFGVYGREGLGEVIAAGLNRDIVPLRVIPFGKSMAASGAIVAGNKTWIDALIQCARSNIYSTAISPALSYGLLETFKLMRQMDDRRQKLYDLVSYFRTLIATSPLLWRDSHTPIQQLQLGCANRAVSLAAKLFQHAIICLPVRKPTVSQQETGLRINLNCHHTHEQIDHLLDFIHHEKY